MDDLPLSPEDDLRILTRILNRSGISNYATPWLSHDSATARFYIENGELKPCARITRRTVTEGIEYKDIALAKAIADLMLQRFGVTLVNEQ